MIASTEILAWKKQPEPKGMIFNATNLNRENVIALFEACKQNTGYINADGWEFLFYKYGLNELLVIDLDIKWFNTVDLKTHSLDLIYEAMRAGYNPIHKEKGDYDDETKSFINLQGVSKFIDWDNL